MTANINPDTGIAYGYISANALDSETVDDLMYGRKAVNVSYAEAWSDFVAEMRQNHDSDPVTAGQEFDEADYEYEFQDKYYCQEEQIEGEIDCPGYGPVQYSTSYLGGALNFWIFKSPFTTDRARRSSPCVPNAGIIDTCDGDVTAYDVPADWRFV